MRLRSGNFVAWVKGGPALTAGARRHFGYNKIFNSCAAEFWKYLVF